MDALQLPPQSAEQTDLVARVAALASTRFAPRDARHDAEPSFPYENYRDLHAAGLLPLDVPRAWGGAGADAIAYAHAVRGMARGCAATVFSSRRRHTRWNCDWSSDVCSSDLRGRRRPDTLRPDGDADHVLAERRRLRGHDLVPLRALPERPRAGDGATGRRHGRDLVRSEERRVGKEGGEWGWPER